MVEVQTNAHHMPSETQVALLGSQTDLIGVSIDGSTADNHDALRSTRGNFRKVLSFLESCRQTDKPVIVRTIINRQNRDELSEIGKLIARFGNIIRWSLLEFTPVGAGYDNAELFSITKREYLEAVQRARAAYTGNARIEAYEGPAKVGTYALVTPEGQLYGTSAPVDGRYPLVGGMLNEHLMALAQSLPFDPAHHHARYGSNALAPELDAWLAR
jgi:MoaA/NifB/PqqE/SkfB family radical SAM enzyme